MSDDKPLQSRIARKVAMRLVKSDTAKFDVSDWNLQTIQDAETLLEEVVYSATKEVLQLAWGLDKDGEELSHMAPFVHLNLNMPLGIMFMMSFSDEGADDVVYSTNLRELIVDEMDMFECPSGKYDFENRREDFEQIETELRSLADLIRNALKTSA